MALGKKTREATMQQSAMTGAEAFTLKNQDLDFSVLSFWQWGLSDLLGNTLRGSLAEFIVAKAIGADAHVSEEWDAYDLVTPSGTKVEVKSAAYVQTWVQKRPSAIQFSIRPTQGWADEGGRTEAKRQADVYVLCLLDHKDRATVDPTNLDQWRFFVVRRADLDAQVGDQKTISLARVKNLFGPGISFGELQKTQL